MCDRALRATRGHVPHTLWRRALAGVQSSSYVGVYKRVLAQYDRAMNKAESGSYYVITSHSKSGGQYHVSLGAVTESVAIARLNEHPISEGYVRNELTERFVESVTTATRRYWIQYNGTHGRSGSWADRASAEDALRVLQDVYSRYGDAVIAEETISETRTYTYDRKIAEVTK